MNIPFPIKRVTPFEATKFAPDRIFNRRKFAEREIGYGNLDDWNALPPVDQARIRGHSMNLLKSFRYAKWFLRAVGRFPFVTKKLEDGSYTFTFSPWNISYLMFLLSSIVSVVTFVLFTIGAIASFADFDPDKSFHDRCGNSWGKTVLSRNMPAVIFVWSQMVMTAAGSIYVIIHGQSFLEFYNLVNEAVMQLDVDPTKGMLANDIRGLVVFGSIFVVCLSLAFADTLHSLEEVSVFVVQCICYFFAKDIWTGNAKPLTALDYDTLLPKCNTLCRGCYGSSPNMKRCNANDCFNVINTPTRDYKIAKWVGLFIMVYSLLAARALLLQFEFFCKVLVNLAQIWNKRFLNYASKDNSINMDDPYRRRITNQLILKDHYEIVRLYNETELNFSFILFVYYSSVFFNLICQFYYTALLSTQVTCSTAVQREMEAALRGDCYSSSVTGINNTRDVLEAGTDPTDIDHTVSFEDACSLNQKTIIRHASITTTVLLIITLTSFIITTVDADRAAHQADIGFYRVRKRGYMSCRTKKERNAMHALVFSFTGPKKFCITAAGYFPVRKKTIITTISVAFVYFLIILSFKPGANIADVRCYKLADDNVTHIYQVRYPNVI